MLCRETVILLTRLGRVWPELVPSPFWLPGNGAWMMSFIRQAILPSLIGLLKRLLSWLETQAPLTRTPHKEDGPTQPKTITVFLIGDSNYYYEGHTHLWTCFGLTNWIIHTVDIKYDSVATFAKGGLLQNGPNIIRGHLADVHVFLLVRGIYQ